jgi:hypothetical protein
MKIGEAYNLLVEDGITDNHRYFAEVYKLYGFTDDKPLKEYLDFIEHEPVHWMRGFPSKLTTKLAFSKPKTAIIKLLKKQSVIQALGADYVDHIYDVVWNTFKKEVNTILAERGAAVEVQQEEGKGDDQVSVGTVETLDTLPTPTPRPYTVLKLTQDAISAPEDRAEFLKDVLMRMADALPDGYADAFRLLVNRV